ncbi:flagellar basal body L-ring protein FlgH [Derxia lacustris]|uniref:flagellar basal body L-ring protein FlgH n=1 Tax=Derxia lacustris TaxID=764842 RepID=UPI000A16E323|nr:flagellar basal body L-ring protein FlgH [Derxia lacustris]
MSRFRTSFLLVLPSWRALPLAGAFGCAALLAGCASGLPPRVEITTPTTVRPQPQQQLALATGSIYQAGGGGNFRPLFEDRRARYVGDTITVQISEKTTASSKQSTNSERKTDMTASSPSITGFLGPLKVPGISATVGSDSKFDGKGQAAADNLFTGTVTCTVMEVLSNGNLVIAGEKQVGIGQNMEVLRLTGVVNPATVLNGNVVASTQIADARLETRGKGSIDDAQTTGWLQRFFNTWSPY